jgi:hypothetical protein
VLILQLGLILLLLVVCCFAPGFFFVRRLRWNPLEKLCGAVALSLMLLYLVVWGLYCAGVQGTLPFALVSLACAAMGAVAWRDITRLVRVTAVQRALAGYGFLLVWTLTLLAMIRVFSGGVWANDWLEHFQRTLFFLHRFPTDTPIFGGYILPARPPMMNLLSAFFLAQTQDRFELFQVSFSFLNLLLFLPCYLLMPALARPGRRRTLLLTGLFAMSPVIMENATYSWTKEGAAFFVVLALWFYLAGWRKNDRLRTTVAFVALAAGLLVHYSAGPYAVFLTLHYFLAIFPKRKRKWRELAGITALCGLLLATWFGWSAAIYGVNGTVASNSSVTSSQKYEGSNLVKSALNFYDTVVPNLLRKPDQLKMFDDQRSSAGLLRDRLFELYQSNLICNMGLLGGLLVLWLLCRSFWGRKTSGGGKRQHVKPSTGRPQERPRGKPGDRGQEPVAKMKTVPAAELQARISARGGRERWFWLALICSCLVLGIAVVGERDGLGVPHLTYLPLVALGLTLLAAALPVRNRVLAILLIAGCAVDFGLGVFLQARIESEENTTRQRVFGGPVFQGGTFQTDMPDGALSSIAWTNWYRKHTAQLASGWLQDMPRQHGSDAAFQQQWPPIAAHLKEVQAEDGTFWHGWYARNGGSVTYLGDDVAGPAGTGTDVATAVLLALFVGLMAALMRQAARQAWR